MMFISSPRVLLLFILSYIATGFNINSAINHRGVISLHNSINEEDTTTTPCHCNQINRRTLITTSIVSSSILFSGSTANAIVSSKSTVIVLGANGQTGKECVSSVGHWYLLYITISILNYDTLLIHIMHIGFVIGEKMYCNI